MSEQAITVRFQKLREQAKVPIRATTGSSGLDLYSCESVSIPAQSTAVIKTGLAVELPVGFEMQIRPRSGMSSKGYQVQLGTVDADYRGEIGVIMFNATDAMVTFPEGTRVAQGVVQPVQLVVLEECIVLTETDRGAKGFGSTGVS